MAHADAVPPQTHPAAWGVARDLLRSGLNRATRLASLNSPQGKARKDALAGPTAGSVPSKGDWSQNTHAGVKRGVGYRDRSDAELLGAVRSDPDAFGSFYDRYEAAVVGYFARRVRDPEVVADLTGEVFAAALGSARRYRPTHPTAAAWLLTIAHNIWINSARRRRVEARARLRLGIRDAVSFQDVELERVEAIGSSGTWLTSLLDGLPREQAEAIRARVLDDREYGEIAQELETSELVIRKRVSRGLASLRRTLEKEDV